MASQVLLNKPTTPLERLEGKRGGAALTFLRRQGPALQSFEFGVLLGEMKQQGRLF